MAVVDSGKPNDPWRSRINDLRRQDLQNLDAIDSAGLSGWPMPRLSFIQVNSLKPRTCVADVIAALYRQSAIVAFVALSTESGLSYHIATPVPDETGGSEADHPSAERILREQCVELNTGSARLSRDQLRSMLGPLSGHIGLLTGMPSLPAPERTSPLEQLTVRMQGSPFGVLVLAVPIPMQYIDWQIESISKDIQHACYDDAPTSQIDINNYLGLADLFLQQLISATYRGGWQMCVYFFAANSSTFAQLGRLVLECFADDAGPCPLRTHEVQDASGLLLDFNLIKSQRERKLVHHDLCSYTYLTPVDSQLLATFIQFPNN